MVDPSSSEALEHALPRLLAVVRRRLWRAEAVRAARAACWIGSAGLIAALGLHLGVTPMPPVVVPALLLLGALAATTWALRRRPDDVACALWADRQLGGASAFTTWLELARASPAAPATPARRQLERWLAGRLPTSRQHLEAAGPPHRLQRPVSALGVCTALALGVLLLDRAEGPEPSAPGGNAPAAPAATGAPRALGADVPAVGAMASALARAARSASDREAAAGSSERSGSPMAQSGPGARRSAARSDGASSTPGAAPAPGDAMVPKSGAAPTGPGAAGGASGGGGTGRGHDLGDRRDDGVDAGVSRAARASFGVSAADFAAAPGGAWQADPSEAARYAAGESPGERQLARALPDAPPAQPPPATDHLGLSPTEASYVRAWMKASARTR